MIYTKMTNKAMMVAYNAHHGQVDKCGIPYIFHPIHLAEQMDDEISCTVALLHDVVEDTEITIKDLAKLFPVEVIDAVNLLTRNKETSYYEYIEALKSNKVAVKVKLADLDHNLDITRMTYEDSLESTKVKALRSRYKKAKEILTT